MKMARIKAEIIKTDGSVLVGVRTPNEVDPVPAMERQYSDWTDMVSVEMTTDALETATDTLITEPHETMPSIASVDEVRAYRVKADGKLQRIYTGDYTDDIDQRCQDFANASGRVVWLMSATDSVPFDPEIQ